MRDVIAAMVKLFNVEVKVTGSVQELEALDLFVKKVIDCREVLDYDAVQLFYTGFL